MARRLVVGRVSLHPRGFGFLNFQDESGLDQAAFITPPDLNGFLDGDVVEASLGHTSDGRFSAQELQLRQRHRRELFGTVVVRGRRRFLKVDRLVSNTDWPLEQADHLQPEAPVVATIVGQHLLPARVLEASADLALERCLVRHGLLSQFPAGLAPLVRSGEDEGRRDLRELCTITIDAPSTTDIDDALSALPPESDGSIRVLVSIADVDSQVAEDSALDLEARQRGTSCYLAGRVLPMLPDSLSSDALSLLPQVERRTLTAELRIDPEGHITAVDLYPSWIRSQARLSYEAVSDFFDGHFEAVPEAVVPTLRWLRTAGARLATVRAARGGVELAREEAYVSFDPATRQPTEVTSRQVTPAHRLVERLMVAANEAVAEWLVTRGRASLFRVHDEPGPDQVEKLQESASHFGLEAAFGGRLTPRRLAAFEAQFRHTPLAPALNTVLGWALGPARYSARPSAHFGLGAPLYLHFTSPIRRYADLVVHRHVKAYLRGERGPQDLAALEQLAEALNAQTLRAGKAEQERLRMLVARLFAQRLGEQLEGNVVAVKPFGLVVQLLGTGVTGTVASDSLPRGPYRLDLARSRWVGPEQEFAVGDPLRVVVSGAQEELGRVELQLA